MTAFLYQKFEWGFAYARYNHYLYSLIVAICCNVFVFRTTLAGLLAPSSICTAMLTRQTKRKI